MSELCTLAASVVLQSANSGAPDADNLPLPSFELPPVALLNSDTEQQLSVGCHGHQAIAKQSLEQIASTIAPETENIASIVEEVEFSQPTTNILPTSVSQDDTSISQENTRIFTKGASSASAPSESTTHQLPISSPPIPRPQTKPKLPSHHQSPAPLDSHSRPQDESTAVREDHTAIPEQITRDIAETTLSNASPQIPSTTPIAREMNWSNGAQSTIPPGWPSLLHPQTPVSPSHQSALPSAIESSVDVNPGDELLRSIGTYDFQSPSMPPSTARPQSGHQLYQQRWAALRAGKTYTRLPSNSFENQWKYASYEPTHEDWLHLLSREARSMAAGQGSNELTVIVGDSLSLWMPTEFLPQPVFPSFLEHP